MVLWTTGARAPQSAQQVRCRVWDLTYEFAVSRAYFPGTCNGVRVALEPFDANNPTKGGIHNSPAKVATAGSVFGNSDSSVQLVE